MIQSHPPELAARIAHDGWVSTDAMVDSTVLDAVIAELPASLAECVLGPECFAVRGILFDKTPTTNWKVVWHQDLSIAVRERRDVPGFGPWSEKAGVTHVQAPANLLARMLAVRVHLDACAADNGPVRVLPGSHREGRLSSNAIEHWKTTTEPVTCVVPRGGLLAFRPLLLHASSPALHPFHRRSCISSSPPSHCRSVWRGMGGGDGALLLHMPSLLNLQSMTNEESHGWPA